MNEKVQKTLPIIFAIISTVGVVATTVLAVMETEKANPKIKEAKATNSKKEVAIAIVKGYGWSITVGAATISSIIAGTIIGKKTEASLTATAIMLDQSLRQYKDKAKALLGDKADTIITKISEDESERKKDKIAEKKQDDKQLYHEEHIGFFWSTPENIAYALNDTNRRLNTDDSLTSMDTHWWASMQTFIYDANAQLIDSGTDKISMSYGWSGDYVNNINGAVFLNMRIEDVSNADHPEVGPYKEIIFDVEPYMNAGEAEDEMFYGKKRDLLNEDTTPALWDDPGFNELSGNNNLFMPSNPKKQRSRKK